MQQNDNFGKRSPWVWLRHGYLRTKSYISRPRLVIQEKPVFLSDEDICKNPIFLIGLHRSGTSLCRRIFNSHSHIACPPETYFLEHFAAMVRDRNTYAGFSGLGYEGRSVATKAIRIWASRFHEAYRKAHGKLRWADKTPQYIEILYELEEIYGPYAQYIIIFRHPLDVIYSIYSRGWRFGDYDPDLLKNTAYYVKDSLQKQFNFINAHPDKCHVLLYEKLIKQPEKTLREALVFLGEPWEPEIMEYHKFNHNFGTEDPVVRGTQGFLSNSDNWKAFREDQLAVLLPIIKQPLSELGYKA